MTGQRASRPPGRRLKLAADAELFDERLVARLCGALEIIEKLATVVDHLDEASAGIVILAVRLQMLREVLDFFREHRDLNVAGTGVLLVNLKLLANGLFIDLTHDFLVILRLLELVFALFVAV